MLSCSLSLFISLSVFSSLSLFIFPCFEVPWLVVLMLVCNAFRIRFPFFNTLSAGYQKEQPVWLVSCVSSLLSRVSKVRITFSHFPFGNSCQSHWLNYDNSNNYSACCHDGLSIRFGMQWVSAKPLSTQVLHYANRLQILIGIQLGRYQGFDFSVR